MDMLRGMAWSLAALMLTACAEEKKTAASVPPPLVSVLELAREEVPLLSTYMGQTAGFLNVDVRAQVTGILMRRSFKEGDFVNKGQVLFEIDPAPMRAALEQAQSQLLEVESQFSNAKRELDRILPLYARNAVSQKDRDSARSSYESARAQVEAARARVTEARIQLNYTRVEAPISGYTSSEAFNEGNLITPGLQLTTINQTDPMYVNFAIPSAEMMMMKRMEAAGRAKAYREGANVTLRMLEGDVFPGTGTVTFVDTRVDPMTSVVRAKALFRNANGLLLPGQYAAATVSGAKLLDAILIPQNAVLQTAMGPMVFLLDPGRKTVSLKPVHLESAFGMEFLVREGLAPGDMLVVEGIGKLSPGMEVNAQALPRPKRQAALSPPDAPPLTPDPSQIDSPAPVTAPDQSAAKAEGKE